MAGSPKEYSNEEVDLAKVIPMVLIHDLVEIDAGDTYAYDDAGAETKEVGRRKRRIVFLASFQLIRGNISVNSGMSLRHMRLQKPNLLMCWIIVSRFF